MTRFRALSLSFAILLIILLGSMPGKALEAPVRIMPLGDSLTYGQTISSGQGGYRNGLHSLLTADGFNVDFVGTFADNNNPGLPDVDHQGLPSARIDQIQDNVGSWLDSVDDPDVVLLLIGTNDFLQGHQLAGVQTRLANLIAEISNRRPFAKIIVSTLIPNIGAAEIEAAQIAFNSSIPDIVAQQVAMGRQVSMVDMHPLLDPPDYGNDGIHPLTTGYNKMAAGWHDAITGVITPQGTSNPPVIARIGNLTDPTHVSVVFSKPVADDSANPANFSIPGGLTVSGAELDAATKRTVTLTTSPQAPGIDYTMAVSGIRDRTDQQTLIAPESMAGFAQDSITNGGFEDDYAGWTSIGNSEIQSGSPYYATEGTKLVSFNSGNSDPGGSLSETVSTTVGRTYQLAFDFGILCPYNLTQQNLLVTVQGAGDLVTDHLSIQKQGGVNLHWESGTYTFTADSATTTITFTDESLVTNNIDLLLDNVRVTPQPIPTLAVTSSPFSGVEVTISQNDIASNGDGTTGLIRFYNPGTPVTITAPAMVSGKNFLNWRKNGVDLSPSGSEITLTMDSNIALDAVYQRDNVIPMTVYQQWLSGFGLTDTPGEDSDGDSIPDAVEYVIGGNPMNHQDSTLLPTGYMVNEDPDGDMTSSGYLLFTYHRTDAAFSDPNTSITVEWSVDPAGPWTNASETGGVETLVDDNLVGSGVDLVRTYLPDSLESDGRLFARLRVIVSPP